MHILTSDQMKSIDRRATDRFGIPSIVLMENAALAVVDAIGEHYPDCDRAAIFCGLGANGGDGFAVARHLEQRGVVPSVFIVGDRKKIRGDAAANLAICEQLALPLYDITDDDSLNEALVHAADADLVVDAIFGTGLDRAPEGLYAEAIISIGELGLPIVAVDLPSGANASTAEPFEPCAQAALTITFAAPKICHVFEPAAVFCGEVIVADISIPSAAIEEENVTLALTTPDTETARLVNAGSIESMTFSGDDVAGFVANKDAVLIGPGLADDEGSYARIRLLVEAIELPLVIDASALNAFALRATELNPHRRPRVLTPHPGELARLIGSTAKDINAHRIDAAREAARSTGCVVVLKGFQSLIAEPDGHVNVNPTGNPGMASGGMGDVLGGMIAALLARGIDPFDAAIAAVYLHGFAGDMLKEEMGDTGLTAGDLAERIPFAIKRLSTALSSSLSS